MMFRTWLSLGLALALAGCGDDSPPPDTHHEEGACGDIVDACHEVDTGVGPIAECHDIGHDGVVEACEPRRDECVALCEAAAADGGAHHEHDAGVSEDAGEDDASAHHDGDGGSTPELCRELGTLCHAYDTGSGPAHDCHEIGHAGELAACEAAEAMCRDVCSGDAGTMHEP